MLGVSKHVARCIVTAVDAKAPSLLRSQPSSFSQFLPQTTILRARLSNLPTSNSRMVTKRTFISLPEPPKIGGMFGHFLETFSTSAKASLRKIFAPPGSTATHKVLAGLNRFGPFTAFNPIFMWRLQTAYRPYVTMGISMLASLSFLSTLLGTPDSTMRLVAVPTRVWSGEEYRLLLSSFVHTHFFHIASASGFFLAFSTAVEVAAGPVTLLAVLLSCAVVGTAAALCAPERSSNMYIEQIQMGLWPAITGLASFFWYGLRKTPPAYLRNNPNLSAVEKIAARQLTATLSQRKLPLIAMAILALAPLPGVDSTAFGAISGGLTGAALGFMYTRSPHLVLINGIVAAAAMTYVAQRPAWTLKYQAFKFARSWEDGDFIRAREWLTMLATETKKRSPSEPHPSWTLATMALVEMACGRTSMAMTYAANVDSNRLVLKSDLTYLRDELSREWRTANLTAEGNLPTNVRFGSLGTVLNPSGLNSMKAYQQALRAAPWRIMNEERIVTLFQATFAARPQLTPTQMQQVILQNYRGLFNFDPSYSRAFPVQDPKTLPSYVRDNPLQ